VNTRANGSADKFKPSSLDTTKSGTLQTVNDGEVPSVTVEQPSTQVCSQHSIWTSWTYEARFRLERHMFSKGMKCPRKTGCACSSMMRKPMSVEYGKCCVFIITDCILRRTR